MKPGDRRALIVFALFCSSLALFYGFLYWVETRNEFAFLGNHRPIFSEKTGEGDRVIEDRIYSWKADWRKVRSEAWKELSALGYTGKERYALWDSGSAVWTILVSEGRTMKMEPKPGYVTVRMNRVRVQRSWVER
ncbi:MAG: hypothetical protein ABL962_02680 [Fimbriimonadaceae bacterium]